MRVEDHTRFAVGDRVIVARMIDTLTNPALCGMHGTIEEVEDVSVNQRNYEVRLDETGQTHYLNDQMLEAAPDG